MLRDRLRQAALVVALILPAALFAPAASAASAPAWTISAAPFPTNFAPGAIFQPSGPGFQITAINVGASSTQGTFTVTDTLPAGLAPASAAAPFGTYGGAGEKGISRTPLNCAVNLQTVSCTGASPGMPPLRSGEIIAMTVPVDVKATGEGSLVNEAAIMGGEAAPVSALDTVPIDSAAAPFSFASGLGGLTTFATEADGGASHLAGSHPYQFTVGLGFSSYTATRVPGEPDVLLAGGGGVRDIKTVLPAGLVVNPQATTAKCTEQQLEIPNGGECPTASQVGMVAVSDSFQTQPGLLIRPLYNMVAPAGSPGVFAFEVLESTYVHLLGGVRSDGRYELSADADDILAKVPVLGAQVTLWGDPSSDSHSDQRRPCYLSGPPNGLCPVEQTNKAFLTMPSACSDPLTTSSQIDSWREPGAFLERSAGTVDRSGNPVGVDGCGSLDFDPSIAVAPSDPAVSTADSPSGLEVDLHVPQNEEFEDEATGAPRFAEANLKDTTVTLPPGVAVNPSAANGLGVCTEAQIGFDPATGHYSDAPAACPDAAKVGSVSVDTPLLDHPLPGAIYIATPHENPFGSLLAIYIAVYDPQTGVVIKLGGHVGANPVSGQLSTTFAENPQLPFEDFHLKFFGGARAALKTAATCGPFSTRSLFAPWSGTAPVARLTPFPNSLGCAPTPTQEPNRPGFDAGTVSALAGSYSPFVLHLNRQDGSQTFGALDVNLPPGLTGKLAGTPYCPDPATLAALGKTGKAEQAAPSCPAASEVGRVVVGAGAGPNPYYVTGHAYLAGPYRGYPLSLAIVTPAVAGPFDLGTVVVRAGLEVNLRSAQITVHSDPLPTILQGIPLDVRSIAVEINKPDFTLNPTSCEPMAVTGQSVSAFGAGAPLARPFQAGGCGHLAFKPKVKLSLKGATKRAGHPALKAVVTYPKTGDYSNIARAQVGLPHSEFLDQSNLENVCTQPELKSDTCPKKSIYGHAKAWSPLLEKPLEGPVYLGVGFGDKLPDLVADLNGQIRILLKGKVDTDSQGGIRNTFEAVPDAPVSRFLLRLKGGKKYGLLENSENICSKTQRASARFLAQNGRIEQMHPLIANSCKGRKGKKHGHKRHGKRRGHKRGHR